MAEAPEVSEDNKDASFSAIFKCGKKESPVSLLEDNISIGKGDDARKIAFQDILKCEVKEKKENDRITLNLIYIEQKKPTVKFLRKVNLLLEGSESDCTSLHEKLEQEVKKVPGRPQNLLVLINPKSGGSSGEKIYQNQVAPFFDLASIKTTVRVSERSGHFKELLNNETLTTYDGLVVVGGDGTIHEVLNGFLPKYQKEAGINIDDPASDLTPTSMTIGVIPAGTGNGIAVGATGRDLETAALAIIQGNKVPLNVASIHANQKLLAYSCLISGHGYFSDLIRETEKKRWLGRSRYLFCTLGSIFSKQRVFGAEVEYLPVQYDKRLKAKLELEETDGEEPGWKKVKDQLTGVFTFNMEVTEVNQNMYTAICKNGISLFLEKSYSRLARSRMFKKIILDPTNMDDLPGMNRVNVTEYKVKLDYEFQKHEEGAESDFPPYEELLNIDGEYYRLTSPSYHYKFHKKMAEIFALDENLILH